MTFWNLYFVLKLYLFAAGHLKPLWIANLGFALALALSAPARRRSVQLLRHALAL
ncbi:cellulose biosynthesis protein BcsG, partial [Burkholderia pseudomallei]